MQLYESKECKIIELHFMSKDRYASRHIDTCISKLTLWKSARGSKFSIFPMYNQVIQNQVQRKEIAGASCGG